MNDYYEGSIDEQIEAALNDISSPESPCFEPSTCHGGTTPEPGDPGYCEQQHLTDTASSNICENLLLYFNCLIHQDCSNNPGNTKNPCFVSPVPTITTSPHVSCTIAGCSFADWGNKNSGNCCDSFCWDNTIPGQITLDENECQERLELCERAWALSEA